MLIDETIPSEVNTSVLSTVKRSIIHSYSWCISEGPLCLETIYGVKFKLVNANVSKIVHERTPGQIIPTCRVLLHASLLLATPRLLEPILFTEISTPADCISAIYTILSKRRGHVTTDRARPGTPLYIVRGFLPAIESHGFETDIRYHTIGQAS